MNTQQERKLSHIKNRIWCSRMISISECIYEVEAIKPAGIVSILRRLPTSFGAIGELFRWSDMNGGSLMPLWRLSWPAYMQSQQVIGVISWILEVIYWTAVRASTAEIEGSMELQRSLEHSNSFQLQSVLGYDKNWHLQFFSWIPLEPVR